MKRRNKTGIILICIGLALLLAALGLYIYNISEDNNAGKKASSLLSKITPQISGQNSSPTVTVEGEDFCGTVIIPTLSVELPVFADWDYTKLKTAPCRYSGSADTDNLIIAAHNYKSHFGNLKQLEIQDEIIFKDTLGTEHIYAVKEIITLDGTAVSDMKAGEWDFTLFTCTKGGKQRVTVRCERIK